MRIAIITDAWEPQINGVVRTYQNTRRVLEALGDSVEVISPGAFRCIPCPTYPSIPLAIHPGPGVRRRLEAFAPEAIHVATEGPVGHAGRRWCLRHGHPFTTTFHTQFPEYLRARIPVPLSWSYRYVRGFHAAAARTLVPTPSQRERLEARGFDNLHIWTRGVDTKLFHPDRRIDLGLERPVAAYMGRVAVEKNIKAFLDLDLPGSKLVIGDGPARDAAQRAHPEVHFTGPLEGVALAAHLAAADVFVFPSLTDTFGVVLLEAMACGVPVVTTNVGGLPEVVVHGESGFLHDVGDTDGMAADVDRLLDDPARRDAMGQAGVRRVTEEFSLVRSLRQHEELYARMLAVDP